MKNLTVILILLVAVILASIGITADLAYSRVSTERKQIKIALKFGSGDLNPHEFLNPPFFYYISFVLYGVFFVIGKLFGIFPSLAAFERFYFSDPSIFYLITRIFVLVLMVAAIIITYKIADKIFNRRTALVASFFMAISPVVIKWSHYATVDIPQMFISLLAFFFYIRISQKGQLRDYLICSFLIGLSIATKYNAVLLLVPFFVAHLCFPSSEIWVKKIFSPKLILGICFVVIGFFVGSPFSFIDYRFFLSDILKELARIGSGDYNFPSWRVDKLGWIYILLNAFPFGLSVPVTIVTILGLFYSLWRHKRVDYVFLSLILVTYLISGKSTVIKPRYFLHIFPLMFILGARFITETIDEINNILVIGKKKDLLVAVICILLVMPAAVNIIKFDYLVAQRPISLEAKEWIEGNIPSGTKIASFFGVPLEANCDSLKRQLKEIQERKIGQGIELKKKIQYNALFKVTYDLTLLPYPWFETYDSQDFDFYNQIRQGTRYFVFTQELEEYLANGQKYNTQVSYYNTVKKNCRLIKEFRRTRLKIEPGYLADQEYIQIYKYNGKLEK